jgi:hypothetical protein
MKSAIRVLVSLIAAVIAYFGALLVSFVLIPSGTGLWRPLVLLTFVALVTAYVWRHSASPLKLLVSGAVMAVLVAAILGWGYRGVLSQGDLQVSILDIALKNDNQAYGRVLTGEVTFNDATGRPLANGRADSRMMHPEAGDCRREEGQGQTAFQRCFDAQSEWLITWVRQVRHATVRLGTCAIDKVPVVLEESRERWWLWWVPHPHLDNSMRTHFAMTLWIDIANCRPADPSRVGSAPISSSPHDVRPTLVTPSSPEATPFIDRLALAQPNNRLQPTTLGAIVKRRG